MHYRLEPSHTTQEAVISWVGIKRNINLIKCMVMVTTTFNSINYDLRHHLPTLSWWTAWVSRLGEQKVGRATRGFLLLLLFNRSPCDVEHKKIAFHIIAYGWTNDAPLIARFAMIHQSSPFTMMLKYIQQIYLSGILLTEIFFRELVFRELVFREDMVDS